MQAFFFVKIMYIIYLSTIGLIRTRQFYSKLQKTAHELSKKYTVISTTTSNSHHFVIDQTRFPFNYAAIEYKTASVKIFESRMRHSRNSDALVRRADPSRIIEILFFPPNY